MFGSRKNKDKDKNEVTITIKHSNDVEEVIKSIVEPKETEPVKPQEEWIWVDGYKGTDKDMKCRDYQYTLGELHNMPNESDIVECASGFHLCKTLKDVFGYYKIGNGNRYFKVRALVRKSDYERIGQETEDSIARRNSYSSTFSYLIDRKYYDKMVARSIIFERELTSNEIFEAGYSYVNDWDVKYREMALLTNIDNARDCMRVDKLIELGYSETFARYINQFKDRYDKAVAVGSQTDLSMDMKCWIIFN